MTGCLCFDLRLPLPAAAPLQGKAAQAAPVSVVPSIAFVSQDDGMEVLLAGDQGRLIYGGKLAWAAAEMPAGSVFRVPKCRQGYHESWETVRAAPEIRLSPLVKEHSNAVEVDWTYGQLLGWVRQYAIM